MLKLRYNMSRMTCSVWVDLVNKMFKLWHNMSMTHRHKFSSYSWTSKRWHKYPYRDERSSNFLCSCIERETVRRSWDGRSVPMHNFINTIKILEKGLSLYLLDIKRFIILLSFRLPELHLSLYILVNLSFISSNHSFPFFVLSFFVLL